jgi:hypothetical protein
MPFFLVDIFSKCTFANSFYLGSYTYNCWDDCYNDLLETACLDNFLRPDPMTVPTPIIAGMTVTINPVNLGDTV